MTVYILMADAFEPDIIGVYSRKSAALAEIERLSDNEHQHEDTASSDVATVEVYSGSGGTYYRIITTEVI